jgi:hypothetical protein
MYILNTEIEDKKTLDTVKDMLKLLGLSTKTYKLDDFYDDIAKSRAQVKAGKIATMDDVMKKLNKK